MFKEAFILMITLCFILIFGFASISAQGKTVNVSVHVEVYSDGSSKVTYYVSVENPPQEIALPLFAKPFYIEAYAGEIPIDVETNETHVLLMTINSSVTVVYYTNDLTEKIGEEWIFKISSPWNTIIIMPENALIYNIQPESFEVTLIGEKVGFEFEPGSIEIKYVITPKITLTTPMTTPPITTSPLTTTPLTITPLPSTSPSPTIVGWEDSQWLLIFTILIIVVLASIVILYTRRRRSTLREELDERDNKIIKVLSKYGEMTAQEIMDKTSIPKTPLYRRLRKLENLGYIESIVRAGRTIYRLKHKK